MKSLTKSIRIPQRSFANVAALQVPPLAAVPGRFRVVAVSELTAHAG